MRHIRSICAAALALGLALTLSSCGEDERHDAQFVAMDTVMGLTAYGKSGEEALSAAESVISALDNALDPERIGSTAYEINNSPDGVVVTGQTAEMLLAAQEVYERSGGAMDLTVYPLVKAWGFVDSRYRVPSEAELESLLGNVGFDGVSISALTDSDGYRVYVPAGSKLSFASVAEGCAAKYAAQAMAALGVESAIISLGSNVQTLGSKPDGSAWSVAIQDPEDTNAYAGIISVGETAVVTSGGYQRYFVGEDGSVYQHIIDPATGYPADSGLLSATVVCSDGTLADALSTALYILGERGAEDYYKTYGGFEMVLITDDGRIIVSSGLRDSFEAGGSRSVEYIRREE